MKSQNSISSSSAWYLIGVLWFTYVVSFLDRMILTLLIEPIKADFGLTDFQSSLLVGFSFVLFYVSFGLPVAYFADQTNRKRLIMIAVTIWGTMTALCGTAKNFTSLLLFRFGVGAGESALHPSALSMISDAFEPERRTLPMSIFLSAATAGVALSYILGSLLYGFAQKFGVYQLPIIGDVKPWQTTLLLVATPAFLSVALLAFVKEPSRVNRGDCDAKEQIRPSEIFKHLKDYPLVYVGSILGPAIANMAMYSFMTWIPSMFARSYGWPPEKSGVAIGLTMVIGGIVGTILVPIVKKYAEKTGVPDSAYAVSIITLIMSAVSVSSLPFIDNAWIVIGAFAFTSIFGVFLNVLPQVSLQHIAPDRLRAQITAIWLIASNLIGFGLGPSGTALLSDALASDGSQLRTALSIFSAASFAVAAVTMYLCRPYVLARLPQEKPGTSTTQEIDKVSAVG
ncbi:MAG: MFS transporter [Pseudomonadota bacterium]